MWIYFFNVRLLFRGLALITAIAIVCFRLLRPLRREAAKVDCDIVVGNNVVFRAVFRRNVHGGDGFGIGIAGLDAL